MRYGVVARRRMCVASVALAAVSLLALASGARAETFNVSNTEQLVKAVAEANGKAGANTIILAAGSYLPSATLTLTNTGGLQTIEGATSLPGSTLNGGSVEPIPSEILAIRSGVSAKLKRLSVTTGGGSATPAIDDAGTLEVESSTVAGNTGPGVHVEPTATATIGNSTFSDGLDVGLISSGTTSFTNSTVAFNAGGGIDNKNTLNLTNTIVADNKGSGDCSTKAATTTDASLDSDGKCGVGALSKTNPNLGALANNGGPTRTRALVFPSPAIDAGDAAKCPTTDQRGVPRPDIPATACDIGAFEASPPPHYFLNAFSTPLPEEAKLPTMSWGTLTLTPASPSKEGTTSCENSAGGFVENPKGGGAGDGQVSVFLSWNCSKPTSCPEAEIEFPPGSGKKVIEEPDIFPGGEVGTPMQGDLGESFPWRGELTEAVAGKIRGETKGVVQIFGCQVKKSVEGSGALGDGDGDSPQFVKKLTVCFTNPSLNAKQEPLTENGSQIGGPVTSKVKFDTPGSGHVLCKGEKEAGATEEITVAGTVTGEIKTFTYEGQEVILTH